MSQQSGVQIGAENFVKLQSYFDALERDKNPVPLTKDGRPNLSAIALACGFDRQVLYKNPACRDLVESKLRTLGGTTEITQPTAKPGYDPKDKRIRELEKQVADLGERLADTQRQLQEAQPYQKLYQFVQETGRDLTP